MTPRERINLVAALADMKEIDYKNSLAVTALIELLIEKGLITRQEMVARAQMLDAAGEKSLPIGE